MHAEENSRKHLLFHAFGTEKYEHYLIIISLSETTLSPLAAGKAADAGQRHKSRGRLQPQQWACCLSWLPGWLRAAVSQEQLPRMGAQRDHGLSIYLIATPARAEKHKGYSQVQVTAVVFLCTYRKQIPFFYLNNKNLVVWTFFPSFVQFHHLTLLFTNSFSEIAILHVSEDGNQNNPLSNRHSIGIGFIHLRLQAL